MALRSASPRCGGSVVSGVRTSRWSPDRDPRQTVSDESRASPGTTASANATRSWSWKRGSPRSSRPARNMSPAMPPNGSRTSTLPSVDSLTALASASVADMQRRVTGRLQRLDPLRPRDAAFQGALGPRASRPHLPPRPPARPSPARRPRPAPPIPAEPQRVPPVLAGHEPQARARASTSTRLAPARRSATAHSWAVDPLVTTSSTSQTWTEDGIRPRTRNAPRTLLRRPGAPGDPWGGVARIRRSSGTTRPAPARSSSAASRTAGSYPRSSRLDGWDGTGTSTSPPTQVGPRSESDALRPAGEDDGDGGLDDGAHASRASCTSGAARSRRPPCFSARTHARAAASR